MKIKKIRVVNRNQARNLKLIILISTLVLIVKTIIMGLIRRLSFPKINKISLKENYS